VSSSRVGPWLIALLLLVASAARPAAAAPSPARASAPSTEPVARIPANDALNGGFLIVNMHGFLFHPLHGDLEEDVAYARWLGSGVIRVFATDNNAYRAWDGRRVGGRIADIAPALRAARVRLIVALVNNHRPVPGELPASSGWMDNYLQLLLPFYTSNWRGPYLSFARDLIAEVQSRGAQDVIYAWELGNELHTPEHPPAIMPFITQAVQELRALGPTTPILAGTMGVNHLDPDQPTSPIARWLYCEAPIDGYTLHAYDWVSPERPGDMPVHWDLDYVTAEPCPDGRRLPVIVEELGTSRALPGVYAANDENGRLAHELRQIQLVRSYPQVVGFGVWNGESPRLIDRTFADTRRGLTSYGVEARGGGSCYDPTPEAKAGVRCELERALRQLAFARMDPPHEWLPVADAFARDPLAGGLEPLVASNVAAGLRISGWLDAAALGSAAGPHNLTVILGEPGNGGRLLAQTQIAPQPLPEVVEGEEPTQQAARALFSLQVPLEGIPPGANTLSVLARSADRGTWFRTLRLVLPSLGDVRALKRPVVIEAAQRPTPGQPPKLDVRWPDSGARVSTTFMVEGTLRERDATDGQDPKSYGIEVFLDPGRDRGGRMVARVEPGELKSPEFRVPVTLPPGEQTLYVHARSVVSGLETKVEIPLAVAR
jgi:hypothetical protein